MEKITIAEPEDKEEKDLTSITNKRLHHKQVDAYFERVETLEENLKKAFTIVWDMCSEDLRGKIKAVDKYDKII